MGDAQPFDLVIPADYNTVFDDCVFEQIVRDHSPAEIRAELARRGISHVLVSWGEIARYRSPGNYGFTSFVEPAVFDRLVAAGVLEPIPSQRDGSAQLFRVVQ